jgi:hypothetical protein
MVSECKAEKLQLDNTKQHPVSTTKTSKETTMMSSKKTASTLVKDILDIIALKPEMFF